ncbi:MAG: tRNA-binding protein [Bdellovibrionaceae bacterium]|nr:tRNA-binding protein [Pseudobdellovibrionaceae bacterium]|tara:strand:+ start:53789 stop:54160 length:372 start_codon:yes stop_codon:yes gene_type:complete
MHINHDLSADISDLIHFDDFLKVDIRMGEIKSAEVFKEARKPAYILMIDFGPTIGIKKSSAQITENYECEKLIGKKIAAVVNFPPRQIGPIKSEVLTLGFSDSDGHVVLFSPDKDLPNGSRLY